MSIKVRYKGSFDWVLILIYLALVFIGWLSIYSTTYDPQITEFFNLSNLYFKQLLWIGFGFALIVFILSLEVKFIERFSSLFYLIALVFLLGLFLFGKSINGATSWYSIGPLTLQPSEFAKAATALALAKYLSDLQTDLKTLKGQLNALVLIALPALIILPQPDPGSALIYTAFFFPLYREGLAGVYLFVGLSLIHI